MKVLLHICCAPCSIYPIQTLRQQGLDVMGFFYRHNIHPYTECLRRQETLQDYAEQIDLRVIYQEGYDLEGFIQNVVYREKDRCRYCYHDRLRATALLARHGKFDYFSSTLLYSKYQNHQRIRLTAERLAQEQHVPFFYQDFREGWQQGVDMSKKMDIYRQPYCGCIYSEQERYDKRAKRVNL